MLRKITLMLSVFLSVPYISNAFKVQMPEITRGERFLPINMDLELTIVRMNAKNPQENMHKDVLLISPENWDHFIRLFNEYQSNQNDWVSPFTASMCREIIFFTTMLDIGRMHLTPDHIAFLPKLLPHLQALSLREYCAHNELIMAIAQINTLYEIDLYQNHATEEGVKALSLLPNLTTLNLGFNQINDSAFNYPSFIEHRAHIQAVANELKSFRNSREFLTSSQLAQKEADEQKIELDAESAIEALSKNQSLRKLNLTGTSLTDGDLKTISTMHQLKRLNLTANYLRNQGAAIISGMNHLESLNVTGNKISNEGIVSLSSMENLKKLNISRNQFSEMGEKILSTMTWLKILNISESHFINNNFEYVRKMPHTQIIGLDDQED